jgi:hypothetical protein
MVTSSQRVWLILEQRIYITIIIDEQYTYACLTYVEVPSSWFCKVS